MTDLVATKASLPAGMEDIFSTDNLSDLTEGAGGGFSTMSIRGSKFRIKHDGDETLITDSNGDPVPTVPVVIVKAQKELSKIFYAKKYEEGDDAAPDCFSTDGVVPDPSAPDPQHDTCKMCPHNVWGSRTTDAGKKAKQCQDNRRTAVVPVARNAEDADPNIILNEQYGGPLLLRIPPASIKVLMQYSNLLKKKYNKNYNLFVTLLGFDPDTSYPKLTFKPIRYINSEEIAAVAELVRNGSIENILTTSELPVHDAEEDPMDVTLEDPRQPDEVQEEAAPVEEPKKEVKKEAKKPRKPKGNGKAKPEPEIEVQGNDEGMVTGIADIMSELDGM